jgi:hypothetical protein
MLPQERYGNQMSDSFRELLMIRRLTALFVLTSAAGPVAHAQSCAAADAVLGTTKKNDQMKPKYDKFADVLTLESKSQSFAYLGQEEVIWISFVATHPGQGAGPLTTAMHLRASHNISGRTTATQTPDRFPDSTTAIVLADSSRVTLHGGQHRASRMDYNIIGPPTVDEDLWFPISTEQLATLARAHGGGIRVGEFDMPMQGKILESAALTYRTAVCSPSYAAAQ